MAPFFISPYRQSFRSQTSSSSRAIIVSATSEILTGYISPIAFACLLPSISRRSESRFFKSKTKGEHKKGRSILVFLDLDISLWCPSCRVALLQLQRRSSVCGKAHSPSPLHPIRNPATERALACESLARAETIGKEHSEAGFQGSSHLFWAG